MLDKPYENRLIKEKSPYLLQHAHNPVDWYPWGEEAFQKAKDEDKPIFLSIGYATCHDLGLELLQELTTLSPENVTLMSYYEDRMPYVSSSVLYSSFLFADSLNDSCI